MASLRSGDVLGNWGDACTPVPHGGVLCCLALCIWNKVFPDQDVGEVTIVMQQSLLVTCIFWGNTLDFVFLRVSV